MVILLLLFHYKQFSAPIPYFIAPIPSNGNTIAPFPYIDFITLIPLTGTIIGPIPYENAQ